MKFLKIVLLSLVVLFTTSFTNEHNIDTPTPIEYSKGYEFIPVIDWTASGAGYWTKGYGYNLYSDFDWMVTRSTNKIGGYYYYDFWFYSQSYYWDGVNSKYTYTNIREVTISVDVGYGAKDVVMDMNMD
jgi:hypothetical protein